MVKIFEQDEQGSHAVVRCSMRTIEIVNAVGVAMQLYTVQKYIAEERRFHLAQR